MSVLRHSKLRRDQEVDTLDGFADQLYVMPVRPVHGHELLTSRDLTFSEPDHARAGQWYNKLQLSPLEHKLPPIVANRWRRVTHHRHQRRPLHERTRDQ